MNQAFWMCLSLTSFNFMNLNLSSLKPLSVVLSSLPRCQSYIGSSSYSHAVPALSGGHTVYRSPMTFKDNTQVAFGSHGKV